MRVRFIMTAVHLMVALASAAADRAPNVLLLVSDDQGYRDLGCFGSDEVRTPHPAVLPLRAVQRSALGLEP